MWSSSSAKGTRSRAGPLSDICHDSMSDPSYVSLDHLLHHPDFAGWFTANDVTMHFCLLFSFTSLELHCSIVDIACISSFLSLFAHFARICCEYSLVSPWLPPRVNPPLGGSQTLEPTTVTHHAEPQSACVCQQQTCSTGVIITAWLSVGDLCPYNGNDVAPSTAARRDRTRTGDENSGGEQRDGHESSD